MRNQRFAAVALLLACFPMASLAETPQGIASFSKQAPGADRWVPIESATLADKVYFHLRIIADDGEHPLQVTVYDGNGREVWNSESTLVVQGGGANSSHSYGFNRGRDAPGTWWYVAALDDKIVLSSALTVSR